MSDAPESVSAKEPALVELIALLDKLPRFDGTKKARELQGDLPEVEQAEKLYHSFNRRYQRRKTIRDKEGNTHTVNERAPLLIELFKLDSWQNFQDLLRHSTVGRDRKQRANKNHRAKRKEQNPETWFNQCREKRRARLRQWEAENRPRLLKQLAAAEQLQVSDARKAHAIRYEVFNELDARYVDEYRAQDEFSRLCLRVLLGLFTQNATDEMETKMWKLAQEIWDEQPWETLQKEIAKRLPPISTDWSALETAMEASEGDNASKGGG
jgi:hypothetical protein